MKNLIKVFLMLALLVTMACSLADLVGSSAPPTPDYQATIDVQQATQVALSVQATVMAQSASSSDAPTDMPPTPEPPAAATSAPPPVPPPTETPAAASLPDFDTWMRSAHVLLYDDMYGATDIKPYIPDALNNLGLNFVDTRDALGNFKTQLLSGGPGGQPWDLVISAKEMHTELSGEFYSYLNDSLTQGSSVIIEDWDVDGIYQGKIGTLLARCGVEFQKDWPKASLDEQVLYPIHGEHPIHHTPHEGIALTNPTGYWGYEYGDLLRLRPGGDAILLWGTLPNVNDSYAVAATCVDDRLIIQTYCTHSYGYDRVVLMWENYIYNALRARYEYLQAHQ